MTITRRPDLDGLRGLAVALVVGFHAGIPALRGAFIAVDIFFVLSGYFLAASLTRRLIADEAIEPTEIVARRLWRLLPALGIVLLGTLASTALYAPIDRAEVAQHMVPVSAFAGNLAFAADGVNYFRAGENPLLHTWTLGVELQLALLVPLLVWGCAALGARRAGAAPGAERRLIVLRTVMAGLTAAAVLSFGLAVVVNDSAPMWAYFGPHTRLWSFAAGALMACLTSGGQSIVGATAGRVAALQLGGLALLLVPAALYSGTMAYPGVVALAPVLGTLCLLSVGSLGTGAVAGRLLASAPLVGLGRLAYPWYLWHWPLMVLGGLLVPGIGVAGRLAWGVAGLVAGWATLRALESPLAVTLVQRATARRPLLAAASAMVGMALLAAGTAWSSARFVQQSVHRRYLAARERQLPNCWNRTVRAQDGDRCLFGARTATATVALLGDSHAAHWLGALDGAGSAQGWRVEPWVMGACPVADLRGLIDGAAERLYARCASYQAHTMAQLLATRPAAVILSNADYYLQPPADRAHQPGIGDAPWIEGLRRTYTRFASAGIPVIVLRGLPWVPFDVPGCLSRRAARLPAATDCRFVPDRAFLARAHRAQDAAARGLGVTFVDMNDQVCPVSLPWCTTERDGLIVFADDNHLTSAFSRAQADTMGVRLDAALSALTRRQTAEVGRAGVSAAPSPTQSRPRA